MKKLREFHEIDFQLRAKNRQDIRCEVVNAFLNEKKGYWTDDGQQVVTDYKYWVESLTSGQRIYLKRPTFLNKGIDFTIFVERFDGDKDKRPSHDDILQDLTSKVDANFENRDVLLQAINETWECKDVDSIIRNTILPTPTGLSIEMILKSLKWLFIEQDITYWNYDGRMMLLNGIKDKL